MRCVEGGGLARAVAISRVPQINPQLSVVLSGTVKVTEYFQAADEHIEWEASAARYVVLDDKTADLSAVSHVSPPRSASRRDSSMGGGAAASESESKATEARPARDRLSLLWDRHARASSRELMGTPPPSRRGTAESVSSVDSAALSSPSAWTRTSSRRASRGRRFVRFCSVGTVIGLAATDADSEEAAARDVAAVSDVVLLVLPASTVHHELQLHVEGSEATPLQRAQRLWGCVQHFSGMVRARGGGAAAAPTSRAVARAGAALQQPAAVPGRRAAEPPGADHAGGDRARGAGEAGLRARARAARVRAHKPCAQELWVPGETAADAFLTTSASIRGTDLLKERPLPQGVRAAERLRRDRDPHALAAGCVQGEHDDDAAGFRRMGAFACDAEAVMTDRWAPCARVCRSDAPQERAVLTRPCSPASVSLVVCCPGTLFRISQPAMRTFFANNPGVLLAVLEGMIGY